MAAQLSPGLQPGSTKQHLPPLPAARSLPHADLAYVFDKFITVQTARILQTQQKLPLRGRRLLNALPHLLHNNRPSLPGYIETSTPAGIVGYPDPTPGTGAFNSEQQTGAAEQARQCEIQALYFMGSTGSVAQTRRSDLDLWVCLPRSRHAKIRPKLDALEAYAATQGVDLQAFAVDPRQFSTPDNTSTASSPLLLDEFYRSACWLAGAYPLWWLVPIGVTGRAYADYLQKLRDSGQLNSHRWIDFGASDSFTDVNLSTAMIRTLQSAFTDAHKALLKVALIESYACGATPLSNRYKEQVLVDGEVDAYLMLADHLDTHFEQDPRLPILQAAWVIKTSHKNARLASDSNWLARVDEWGFSSSDLEQLRSPEFWSMQTYLEQNSRILDALTEAWQIQSSRTNPLKNTLPAAHQLKAEDLKRRLSTRPTLIEPGENYRAAATIQTRGEGFQLRENGKTLTQADSKVGLVRWMLRRGFGPHTLATQNSADHEWQQLFAALANVTTGWLITYAEASGKTTTLAHCNDPLSYGHQQHNLLTHCYWIDQANDLLILEPTTSMVLSLLAGNGDIVVLGGLRKSLVRAHLLALATEARDALDQPNAKFLYALDSHWVGLSKEAEGRYHSEDIADLGVWLAQPSAARFVIPSKLSYFSPRARALLEQSHRA